VLSHFLFLTRRQLGPLELLTRDASFPPGDGAETAIHATLTAGGVTVEIEGSVGTTTADDHNEWTLESERGSVRLRDWSFAEKLAVDVGWHAAPHALPNERMRPMVLQGQLDKVAALTRGETQNLATLREALDVQEVVESILGG
jgi:predicted dehydrogenase